MLKIGDMAPHFTLENSEGQSVKLNDFKGKKVVVYFYPKDNTPGCTVEAMDFSRNKDKFDTLNTVILGISKDSVKSHKNFCEKKDLTITLLSDPSQDTINAYEAEGFAFTKRRTFLIDEEGKILKIWPKVKVAGHVDEVLAEVSTS